MSRTEAVISSIRKFSATPAISAAIAPAPATSRSAATICEPPANTMPPMTPTCSAERLACAASSPKARP
jgi:hypothetical protein